MADLAIAVALNSAVAHDQNSVVGDVRALVWLKWRIPVDVGAIVVSERISRSVNSYGSWSNCFDC